MACTSSAPSDMDVAEVSTTDSADENLKSISGYVAPDPVTIDWKRCVRVLCGSNDDTQEFRVPVQMLAHIATLKQVFEGMGLDVDEVNNDVVVPLEQITPWCFERVLDFVQQRLEKPCELCPVLENRKVYTVTLGPWARNWGKQFNANECQELAWAANFLAIKDMVQTMCQTISSYVNHMTEEQMIEFFGPPDEFTEEEKAELEKEREYVKQLEEQEKNDK